MPDPDYAKLTDERFTGTKTHGYDLVWILPFLTTSIAHTQQITAVSQGAIKRQMKLMYKNAADNSPIRKFYTDTTEDDDWTCIKNAELGPSSVELLLPNDDKQTVLFTLNLKVPVLLRTTYCCLTSNLGRFFSILGRKKVSSDDWRLVFRVRLNLKILDDNKVPEFVKRVLVKTDDYSVHQLFVDFTTADISTYDEALSHIDLPTDAAKLSFTDHIKLYLKKLTKETGNFHSTIHYLPTIKKPENYRGPSRPPTSLDFQNLPFVTSPSDKGMKNDDKNMLIYLQMARRSQMIKDREFPQNLLPWPAANWVVPPTGTNPKYDGTVCLSKFTFLDGWLLERLARFNRATTWVLKSITFDSSLTPLPFNIDAHLGYSSDEVPKGGTPWVYDSQKSTPSTFYYSYNRERIDNKKLKNGPKGEVCLQDGGTWNHLEIPVGLNADGKCVIKIFGRTEVWSWASMSAWCIAITEWTATVTLDAVNHGKLMIKVDFPEPRVYSEAGVAWRDLIGSQYDGVIADLNKRVEDGVKKVGTVISELKTDIESFLGGKDGSWSFIFGGNDDFMIDKVAFNSEGDLLAQLVYQLKD
ncbi:hypothetical protein GALMADRAFT_215494 [Galerina marginata CBS 339.88]|uniref:Uncharacterized protein n=1 Tax=Galerina marginata (strain CBS 339.88) TaxID=685588 RepID=A0A067SDB9_GALM3|nr:hypothetical protein GALMADRAFT_215494 [Galerina marginata CBS 339.88]